MNLGRISSSLLLAAFIVVAIHFSEREAGKHHGVVATVETGILLETRWLHLSHRLDPLDRARGSRNLAGAVAQAEKSTGAQFIIVDNYMTAALLSFYLPGQPETFLPDRDSAAESVRALVHL